MAGKAVGQTVDFQLLDNGTAALTATPTDSFGFATSLPATAAAATWTSSDPGLVITANASDPTGLTAVASPASPPVLLTGAIPTCSCNLGDAAGTVITGSGDPIDVVAGPAGSFAVVEQ